MSDPQNIVMDLNNVMHGARYSWPYGNGHVSKTQNPIKKGEHFDRFLNNF